MSAFLRSEENEATRRTILPPLEPRYARLPEKGESILVWRGGNWHTDIVAGRKMPIVALKSGFYLGVGDKYTRPGEGAPVKLTEEEKAEIEAAMAKLKVTLNKRASEFPTGWIDRYVMAMRNALLDTKKGDNPNDTVPMAIRDEELTEDQKVILENIEAAEEKEEKEAEEKKAEEKKANKFRELKISWKRLTDYRKDGALNQYVFELRSEIMMKIPDVSMAILANIEVEYRRVINEQLNGSLDNILDAMGLIVDTLPKEEQRKILRNIVHKILRNILHETDIYNGLTGLYETKEEKAAKAEEEEEAEMW